MPITEAAASGTPAAARATAGHRDALVNNRSGLLSTDEAHLADNLAAVLTDEGLRNRLATGALKRAEDLTWDDTALGTFRALAGQAMHHRPKSSPTP